MSSWDCRYCGEVNPCSKTVCRGCGRYRFNRGATLAAFLLAALLLSCAASAYSEEWQYTVTKAQHNSWNCTFNLQRTVVNCTIDRANVTESVKQVVADGTTRFFFDTRSPAAGIYGSNGLIAPLAQTPGAFMAGGFVTYRIDYDVPVNATWKHVRITKQLAVRDKCWFDLPGKRVYCDAKVLAMDGGRF